MIDAILNGEEIDLADGVFVYELAPGEGCREWNCSFQGWCSDPDESELLFIPGRQMG